MNKFYIVNKYIEKRISFLKSEKESVHKEYINQNSVNEQQILADRNMMLSMELSFLGKLHKAIVNGSNPCEKEGCFEEATCGNYCGGHCKCLA